MSISVPKLFSDREDDSYLLLPSSNINLYLALGGKLDISDNITLKSNFIYKSNKIDNVGILNALVGINAILIKIAKYLGFEYFVNIENKKGLIRCD